VAGNVSPERTWHFTLGDLIKVKEKRVKRREKCGQRGEEEARKRKRSEDRRLTRRRWGNE